MNLRNLKTLVAVADHGNFARAANAVGLTQSAVSMQMRALEDFLGIQLFDRSKRPAVLNERGDLLVRRARLLVRSLEGLIDDSISADSKPANLHLGAVRSTLSGLMPRALIAFNRQFPGIRINVIGGLPSDLIARIENGQLDGAVVSEPQYRPPNLHWIPLMNEPLTVIAAMEATGDTYNELLTRYPYISLNRGAWGGRVIEECLHSQGIMLRPIMEFDNIESVMLTVHSGVGCSIVHQGCVDHPLRSMLRRVPLGDPPLSRRLGLLIRPNSEASHVLTVLAHELKRGGDEQSDIWWSLQAKEGPPTPPVSSRTQQRSRKK